MFNRITMQLVSENPDKAFIFAIGNVNRIKVINDLYGAKKGDLVIAKIGESLNEFSKQGAVVSRFGADNFAICIEDTMENLEKFYNLPVWDFKEYGISKNKITDLNPKDFVRVFEQRYRQPFKIPEEVIDEMFDSMLKTTPTKRNINCGLSSVTSCYSRSDVA